MPVLELYLGDLVRLRKPHPCGGFDWEVVRLGADIGAKCQTCGHRIMLDRPTFERRIQRFLQRGPAASDRIALPGMAVRHD